MLWASAAALVLDSVEFGFPNSRDTDTSLPGRGSLIRACPRPPGSLVHPSLDRYNCKSVRLGTRRDLRRSIDLGFAEEWRMSRLNVLLVLGGVLVGLIAATHLPLRAQGDGKPTMGERQPCSGEDFLGLDPGCAPQALSLPLRPADNSDDLAQRLSHDLGGPVVLDLAALDRLDIKPEDTVKLELEGVRLKTGLKLLLDQVGLTYRLVPEDNLLILTDKEGSEDPIERLASEVHELHRDIHDIQDSLDEVRELTGLQGAEGARSASRRSSRSCRKTPIRNPRKGLKPEPSRAQPAPDPTTKPRTPSARPRTRL